MDDRSADQIQRDIERNRAEMSETVDALERKLSAGQVFDELWGRVRTGETGTNIGETLRDHPIPLALMGLGLGWLAIEKSTGSRGDSLRAQHPGTGEGTYARAEGRVGPYRGEAVIDPDLRYGDGKGTAARMGEAAEGVRDRVTGMAGDLKDRVSEMGGDMKDRLSSATDAARERFSGDSEGTDGASGYSTAGGDGGRPGLGERASHLREGAGREMHHARDMMNERGRQMERGFRSILDDYPLALGAVSFGIGLAAGAAVPTSRAENELMGDTADTLKREAKRMGQETAGIAKEVAGEAANTMRAEAQREGIGDDLKAKAERVMDAATRTAHEQAESKGLTGEAMQERAREIGEKTRESAREASNKPSS